MRDAFVLKESRKLFFDMALFAHVAQYTDGPVSHDRDLHEITFKQL